MPPGLWALIWSVGAHKACERGLFGSRCGRFEVVVECVLNSDGFAPKRNGRAGTERFVGCHLALLAPSKAVDNPRAVTLDECLDALAAGAERCAGVDLAARSDAQVKVLDALFGDDDGDGCSIRSGHGNRELLRQMRSFKLSAGGRAK